MVFEDPAGSPACSDSNRIKTNICKEHWWSDTDRGNLKYQKKILTSGTMFTVNVVRTGLATNLGLRDLKYSNNKCMPDRNVPLRHPPPPNSPAQLW
jgi:hypothetical protein